MAQLLVRDVEEDVVDQLKARARMHGRSLEAELRQVLRQAAGGDIGSFAEEASRIRAIFAGRRFSDSADLIREDRDR